MRHRSRVLKRTPLLGVVVALLATSCGSATPFPRDASSTLKDAAKRTASAIGATLTGTVDDSSGPIVRVSGNADFRVHAVSLTTSSARATNRFPPFENRFVDGWEYVQLDSAVTRPRAVRPDVKWIAFRGQPGRIPLPSETLRAPYPVEILDKITSGTFTDAHFVGASPGSERRVEFRLPSGTTSAATFTNTATIGSDGRIKELTTTARFEQGGTIHEQQGSDLTYTFTADIPPIAAPPDDEVQRLTPGQDLYATGSGPTTTTPPVTIGPVTSSDAAAGNRALFDSDRADLEKSFRAMADPKFVSMTYDDDANEIRVEFASAHPISESRDRYDAIAWQTGKSMAGSFWFPEILQAVVAQHGDATWLPKLRIEIDKVAYQCPSRTEIAVAATGLAQKDWVAQCSP
jgi:hypothetical protein